MDLKKLEHLRHVNQDLLQTLRMNQAEFKKQLFISLSRPLLKGTAPKERQDPNTRNRVCMEDRDRLPKEIPEPVTAVSMDPDLPVARSGLLSSSKPAPFCKEKERRHHGCSCQASSRSEIIVSPSAAAAKNPTRKKSVPLNWTEAVKDSSHLHGFSDRSRPRPGAESDPGQVGRKNGGQSSVCARMPDAPKSILLTPGCKESKEKTKKETGHVTFLTQPEEYTIASDDWSVRPFLGYDWIAGLLDMDSSLAEKPEKYFAELQDFRRVNRDACIYDPCQRSEPSGSPIHDQELETDPTSHQCVYCYRLNKRLFAVPVASEAACPICKNPRTKQPPETLVEPAFVRISIPRSSLLPPYKHKIHRRKSYDPADNLALPSHCLAGWENTIHTFSSTLSSLDLRSSLPSKPPGSPGWNSVSRVSGGTRTDELLNLSHTTEFELRNVSRLMDRRKPSCYKATCY